MFLSSQTHLLCCHRAPSDGSLGSLAWLWLRHSIPVSSRAVFLCAMWSGHMLHHSKGAALSVALSAKSQAGTEQCFPKGSSSSRAASHSWEESSSLPGCPCVAAEWVSESSQELKAGARGGARPSCPSAVAGGACGALAEVITSQTATASKMLPRWGQAGWSERSGFMNCC